MQDWDDLRFFLAVAQSRSVTAAAKKLKVNQSTVSRRINNFEKAQKVRLFERLSTGYELTTEGEELFQRVKNIEDEIHAIDRHVMGKNIELKGPIRITCPLAIAQHFLIPLLRKFHDMHPGIVIHLDLSNSLYNLTAREADVAIRVTRNAVPETLVGRKLGMIDYRIYGTKNYIKEYLDQNGVKPLHWIGETNSGDRPAWLPTDITPIQQVMSTNDVYATFEVIRQGMGVGRLPSFLGKNEKSLAEFQFKKPISAISVWILSHPDMRRVNRINLLTAFITEELRNKLNA